MGYTLLQSFFGKGNTMFSLNDKVVYPGHGVACIHRVFQKTVGTQVMVFYELKFQSKDMTIMVPKEKMQEVGVRPISSNNLISSMLETLTIPTRYVKSFETNSTNWNKRNKEYQSKLRTGSLQDISDIYRDLKYISRFKELSFGEKNLLLKTEALLAEEISAAEKVDAEKAIEKLRSPFVPFFTGSPSTTASNTM